jgi:deazaflavin-dependent oxidoreductase (nitroreductase family)
MSEALIPTPLKRWMYRGDRPGRVAALLNRGWAMIAASGHGPRRMAKLEVAGRRTGHSLSFPVMVADLDGERYLVAMLGTHANWVANVRAAGGRAVLDDGEREAVQLEEVPEEKRPPILKRYLQIASGARAHIPIDPQAPLADFAAIAGRCPAFRIRAE